MAEFSHYIIVGKKQLRCGYTTGTCAAAAALGSAQKLLLGTWQSCVTIETPVGICVEAELLEKSAGSDYAECAVCKDGGDDPDVTNGELVFVRVEKREELGVAIDGGEGVGRVTKPGLDQPVGAAAINSTPRRMIENAVLPLLEGKDFGLRVTVSVPNGETIAKRTFNPRLGIMGGISILGTSGIVRPMSEAALIESIRIEMNSVKMSGAKHLLVTPGNYGEDFSKNVLGLSTTARAICSNYVGEAIDYAVLLGFESVLLVGHLGKLSKVAAGCMNTHSAVADARRETIAAHAAMCGADRALVREIFDCISSDSAAQLLKAAGILDAVMDSIAKELGARLRHRAGDMKIEALFFSNKMGVLGKTDGADTLLKIHK